MARAKTFSWATNHDGMLADYEIKMRSLRNDIQAADAEIDAGLDKRYANGRNLFNDVMNEG